VNGVQENVTGIGSQTTPATKWVTGRPFNDVSQASTTGIGSGMTIDINVDAVTGVASAVLDQAGTGYVVGDIVTFNAPDGSGAALTLEVTSVEGRITAIDNQTSPAAKWIEPQNFTGVTQTSTTGDGSGMIVDIAVDGTGEPTVTLVDPGSGYIAGETITFAPPAGFAGDPITVNVDGLLPSIESTITLESITDPSATIPFGEQDATGMAFAVTLNDVRGGASASIDDAIVTVDSGDVRVAASEEAVINALTDIDVFVGGNSVIGGGSSIAVGGAIATNVVLSNAIAEITDSDLTTTTSGNVLVDARNLSAIDANIDSDIESNGTSVGVILAFNSIGWESQNFLFNTIDALIGTDIGTQNPAQVKALIANTEVDAAGGIAVSAQSDANINAQILNSATAVSGGIGDQDAISVGAIITMNRLSTEATAAIDDATLVRARGGDIDLSAMDMSTINADVAASALSTGVSVGGDATAISVGASIARNQINNNLQAYAEDVAELRASGDVKVYAEETAAIKASSVASAITRAVGVGGGSTSFSGGLATATNYILGASNAGIRGSSVYAGGNVDIDAINSSNIKAEIKASAEAVGASVGGSTPSGSIGISIARNFIAFDEPFDYSTESLDNSAYEFNTGQGTVAVLAEGDRVRLDQSLGGGLAGQVYKYVGTGDLANVNLATQNYAGPNWQRVVNVQSLKTGDIVQLDSDYDDTRGEPGELYEYTGANGDVDIGLADYTIGPWSKVEQSRGSTPVEAHAYIENSDVDVDGWVDLNAESTATIDATVESTSLAVAGATSRSTSLSGAGIFTENRIATSIKAYVDGDGPIGLLQADGMNVGGNGLSLSATDDSTIIANTKASSVAGSLGFSGATAVSIGLSLAFNTIDNDVAAYIADVADVDVDHDVKIFAMSDAEITATSSAASVAFSVGAGGSSIAVSGGAAIAQNVILSTTNAYIENSGLDIGVDGSIVSGIDIDADSTSLIKAEVIASSGSAAVGTGTSVAASLGLSLARNFIGWDPFAGGSANYTSNQQVANLAKDQVVEVVSGARDGDFYKYIGENKSNVDLVVEDYGNSDLWQLISLTPNEVQVRAYISDSSVNATGAVTLDAVGSETIEALNIAGSVAIAAGGGTSVGATAAGVYTENRIRSHIKAFIDGGIDADASDLLNAGSVALHASDSARIVANAVAVSIGGAIGSTAVAVSVGISAAYNEITNQVDAFIANVDGGTVTGDVVIDARSLPNDIGITPTYNTNNGPQILQEGDLVEVATGHTKGGEVDRIYKYRGYADFLSTDGGRTDDLTTAGDDSFKLNLLTGSLVKDVTTGKVFVFSASGYDEDNPFAINENQTIQGVFGNIATNTANFTEFQVDLSAADYTDTRFWEVADASIVARSAAASLAFAAGSTGISVSGAGALALNVIGSGTNAYIKGSTLSSVTGKVDIDAQNASSISAIVGAVSAAVGVGSTGVGVSIGAAIAMNKIGFDLAGNPLAMTVQSYIEDSSINADGALTLDAHANQKIDAVVLAGSVAVAAGSVGVAVSGSGVFVMNQIGADVNAYIQGVNNGGTDIIEAGSISIHASDDSVINNVAGAAAAAIAVGQTGVAVSIGAAVAVNEISTSVDAHISDMADGITADEVELFGAFDNSRIVGDIVVNAVQNAEINAVSAAASIALGFGQAGIAISGAGASATNYILTTTNATIERSKILNADAIDIDATNTSKIDAIVVAASAAIGGGQVGVGASIGVSLARNLIGFELGDYADPITYTTGVTAPKDNNNNTDLGFTFAFGDTVLVDGGINDGDVYKYIGPVGADALKVEEGQSVGDKDLRNTDLWEQVNLDRNATNVIAKVVDTSIDSQGTLSVTATSDQTIESAVIAGSVAVGAGQVGVGISGAGVSTQNKINSNVKAYIDGDGSGIDAGISVGAIDIDATDSSTINATAGAASIAAGFGQVGVSISIGVAIASNTIDNNIMAYITNADSGISAFKGDIDVHASDDSTITVDAVAASLAFSVGQVGVALAGAGAIAENIIGNDVQAFIDGGSIVEAAARFNYFSTETLTRPDADFTTDESPASILTNQVVELATDIDGGSEGLAGQRYIYIGTDDLLAPDLANINYVTDTNWRLAGAINPGDRVFIVNALLGPVADFTTAESPASIQTDQVVELATDIDGGEEGRAGQRYIYIGTAELLTPNLASINYVTDTDWRLTRADQLAGQIYQYFGTTPLLPEDPAIPVINLDEIIYSESEVIFVLKAGATAGSTDPNDYDAVPGWRLLEYGAIQDVNVTASNTSAIDTLVGGVAAAVSGGMVAASGAVGVAIGRNVIGDPDTLSEVGEQVTKAYIADSAVIASGDIMVDASASETIEADVFAGSVAIAVGIGAAIAGAGAELSNYINSDVQAYVSNSDLAAMDDISVLATSNSQINKAQSLGVAVSGSLGAASVAISLVDNTIANDVDAYITSTGATNSIMADGDLTILADVTNARIVAAAETASVSVGLVGLSGGGIDINNIVRNTINADLTGNLDVATAGDVLVRADENTYMSGEALSIAASFSLGAAVGAAEVRNTADSDIEAAITNAKVTTFGDVDVIANSVLNINNTDTAGISGSLVGVTVNKAIAVAQNTVKAGIRGAEILAETGTVTIKAEADNDANATAVGGAAGAIAVGAMKAETRLGGTGAESTLEEVVADIGSNTVIRSAGLTLESTSNDDIFAQADALSGGLVGVAGANVDTVTRQDSIARIGDNVEIHTGTLEINALKGVVKVDFDLAADPTPTVANGQVVRLDGGATYKFIGPGSHVVAAGENFNDVSKWKLERGQSVDASGDALAFGLGAGTGVDVDNLILGQSVVDIGQNSELFASDIFVDAKNIVSKERFKNGFNLSSGSVGLVSFGIMSSTTEIGRGTETFDARVDIGNGTLLQVDTADGEETAVLGAASRDAPRIEIETYVNAKGVDNVKVDAVSGLVGGAKGKSVINAELNSEVNVNGATIVNNAGDVFFTTRTDTLLRPNANLTVVSGLTGGGLADVETITNSYNEVTLTNAVVRGSDISLFAGQDSIRVPNVMFSFGDAQVFTASLLPSISVPVVVATLNENNIINVEGASVIEAASDINLYATEGIGGGDRAGTTGSVLSLSLVPYGVDVPDRATVTSNNQVNIDGDDFAVDGDGVAYLEAGINNQAPFYLKPISTVDPTDNTDLPQSGIDLPDAASIVDHDLSVNPTPTVAFGEIVKDLDGTAYLFEGTSYTVVGGEDFATLPLWREVPTLEAGDEVARIDFDLTATSGFLVSNGNIVKALDGAAYLFKGTSPHTVSETEDFTSTLWQSIATLETGGVALTQNHKKYFGLVENPGAAHADLIPIDADLEFEAINLDKIGFFVDNGTVIQNQANGKYYILNPEFLISDESINLVLQDEDYSDTDRWKEITVNHVLSSTPVTVSKNQIVRGADDTLYRYISDEGPTAFTDTTNFSALDSTKPSGPTDPEVPRWATVGQVTASNVSDSLQDDLEGKFYVVKPVSVDAPVITYVNIGNLLVQQLAQVEAWIANHQGDPEAVARYSVQRDDIIATMTDLGLTVDNSGFITPIKELDTVLFDVPDILSSAGSVFVKVDNSTAQGEIQILVDDGRIVPNAGARIDIQNQTPISMAVNDTIIEDNRRIEAIGGGLVVFTPGNVYVNGVDLTDVDDTSAQDITILQDALLPGEYNLGGLTLPDVPQDLFINGDVINENGDITISNREGSINVSGVIRGEQVDIVSARNFSLNTEGWFHTNQDPRQYIEYTLTRNTVFEEGKPTVGQTGGEPNLLSYNTSNSVTGIERVVIPGPTLNLNGNLVALPGTTQENVVDPRLDEAIDRDESRILSQGRITITAKFLNINGLIQSGTDNISLDIASSFAPPSQTSALADEFNNPLVGITFGDGIPVDGYWDAANQRIVIEEIVPQGGEIILAGQIISTGNGLLRVANGFTDVNINNRSNFDIYIERIDVTTDKEGKIQITDTSTGDGSELDPFERYEYTFSEGDVVEQLYHGTVQNPAPDRIFVEYVAVGSPDSIAIKDGAEFNYQPVQGTQYFWVEGQEKTQTEVKYFKKNTFNLFGGGTWFDDVLAADESYLWRTFEFTDEKPLLESEGIILEPPGSVGDDVAYSVDYKTTQTATPITTQDNWTTGGGWLRRKSYHKLVTTVSGIKDFYTHILEADVPIAIDFIDGSDEPTVTIRSGGSIDFGEINVPDTVDSKVIIETTGAGSNILQDVSKPRPVR
jgi:hypothetical protein